jgi:hypothetical protein
VRDFLVLLAPEAARIGPGFVTDHFDITDNRRVRHLGSKAEMAA